MKEYQTLLDMYSHEMFAAFTYAVPKEEWGNKTIATKYLERYWLPETEYNTFWRAKQDTIFINQSQSLPSMLFAHGYSIIALNGGILFEESDFRQLQECVLAIGDKHIVVAENSFGGKAKHPLFRMKFPADISWEELMSGNFISAVLCELFENEYFVFGESTAWGKYAANEYLVPEPLGYPLDLIGFKPEYAPLFKRVFTLSNKEKKEIRTLLPSVYKDRVL